MIKITTDSTCDLPRELLERHHITVTPLGIIKAIRTGSTSQRRISPHTWMPAGRSPPPMP